MKNNLSSVGEEKFLKERLQKYRSKIEIIKEIRKNLDELEEACFEEYKNTTLKDFCNDG